MYIIRKVHTLSRYFIHTLNYSSVLLHCLVTVVRGREGGEHERARLHLGLSPPTFQGPSSGKVHRTGTHYERIVTIATVK